MHRTSFEMETENSTKIQDICNKRITVSTLIDDVKRIVGNGIRKAYQNVNTITVYTYWQIGKRIVEEEQNGEKRAEYGSRLITTLAEALSAEYASGYTARDLRNYRQLYLCFNDLEIWYTRVPNLTWSHYRTLLSIISEDERYWYVKEASNEMWSVRTLARNVGSQYYHRLMQSPKKDAVIAEMKNLTTHFQDDTKAFLKDPVVAEFLQLPSNTNYTETELEKSIIKHLRAFLLELGRGFAFMNEQYHIKTDVGDFYIDLVFYNVILKCYVLIDLKTKKVTHQDVGQMDMYVRMFDELKRTNGDNPTIGLLLCSETSEDIAKYSVLHDNKQLFQAKYLTFLPSEDELRREIEHQKEIFLLQHNSEANANK